MLTVAFVDDPVEDTTIAVTREMEVSGHPIDLKEAIHAASFPIFDICHYPIHFLVIRHLFVTVYVALWKSHLL